MVADDSMPVLTAATSKSSKTASIWAAITEGGSSKTSVTSSVFCAVIAVMTDMANTPLADMALMSAWMPAPPPESEPAMVSTCLRVVVMAVRVVRSGEMSEAYIYAATEACPASAKSDHTSWQGPTHVPYAADRKIAFFI